jgi:hypothetical protein
MLLWSDRGGSRSSSGHMISLLVQIVFPALTVRCSTAHMIMVAGHLSLTHHGGLGVMCLLVVNTCNMHRNASSTAQEYVHTDKVNKVPSTEEQIKAKLIKISFEKVCLS